jgi:small membrane protein
MTLFQAIIVPSCLLVAVVVSVRTMRRSLSRWSGLCWTVMWLTTAFFIAEPTFLTAVARWLGIGRGADLVLYFAVLAGLGIVLYFYGRFRRLEVLVTGLIRREALEAARHGGSSGSSELQVTDSNLPRS